MRILLADHHNLYREAAAGAVQQAFRDASVHQIASSDALLTSLPKSPYDLVVAALEMPGLSLQEVGRIIQRCRHLPLVLVSGVVRPSLLRSLILYGAAGVVPRTASVDYLVQALRFALAGGLSIPRDFVSGVDSQILPFRQNGPDWIPRLTPREREVLYGLCAGECNKQIGRALGLSPVTVKLHVRSILRKMRVKTRSEAAATAELAGASTPEKAHAAGM